MAYTMLSLSGRSWITECQARLLRTDEALDQITDDLDDQISARETAQDAILEKIFSLQDPDVFVRPKALQYASEVA